MGHRYEAHEAHEAHEAESHRGRMPAELLSIFLCDLCVSSLRTSRVQDSGLFSVVSVISVVRFRLSGEEEMRWRGRWG